MTNEPKRYTLVKEEREALDEIVGVIRSAEEQRIGMLKLLARKHGAANANISYEEGVLIVTPAQGGSR